MWDTLAATSNYDLRMVNICKYKNGHGMGMVYGIGFTTINIDLCLPLLPLKHGKHRFLLCVIPACSSPEREGGTLQKWPWKIACKNSRTSSNPQKWLWKMLSVSTYSATFTTLGFRNSQGCLLKALLLHSEGPEAIERDERQGLWWSLIAGKNWYKLVIQKMNRNIMCIITVLLY